jgi:hypothetical protein
MKLNYACLRKILVVEKNLMNKNHKQVSLAKLAEGIFPLASEFQNGTFQHRKRFVKSIFMCFCRNARERVAIGSEMHSA